MQARRPVARLLATALCVLAIGPFAAAADIRDAEIKHLSRNAVLERPAALPTEGYLSTGQPSEAVLKTVADAGFAAVIDLRGAGEKRGIDEKAAVESLGMTYVSLPVPGPADATVEKAAALEQVLAGIEGPVLLHCRSGNRVGALFALSAKAEGASNEEALAIGKSAGLSRWEKEIREKLESE